MRAVVAQSWRGPADLLPWRLRTVLLATASALVLHVVWLVFLARPGGDLAAQDAWTWFALVHPSSAYDFAWYGGLHPAAYSLISPYIMGTLGVRLTMVVAGTLSAGLVALLLDAAVPGMKPAWTGVYSAVAITGNAVSGRVTFGLGVLFGLLSLTVLLVRRSGANDGGALWWRHASAALFAGVATASSPVAGLFLGLVAVSLWLNGQRPAALAVGTTPVVVFLTAAYLFPSGGVEPMSWVHVVLPLVVAVCCWALLPRRWRLARVGAGVYACVVVAVWIVPSPIGTNVSRLGLLFGGVILVAGASGSWWDSPVARRLGRRVARTALTAGILTTSIWQLTIAGADFIGSRSAPALGATVPGLVAQLHERGAGLGRVEVVPTKSHVEASELSPYVVLARGWNRQADVSRNPIFYRSGPISLARYHQWLRFWAVRFVILPHAVLDSAGQREAAVIRSQPSFLRLLWADGSWSLYEVTDPLPVVSSPGSLRSWSSVGMTVQVRRPGDVKLRVAWSPWLSIVDDEGRRLTAGRLDGSCLTRPRASTPAVTWVVLDARRPGLYRIGAPYSWDRGTPCSAP